MARKNGMQWNWLTNSKTELGDKVVNEKVDNSELKDINDHELEDLYLVRRRVLTEFDIIETMKILPWPKLSEYHLRFLLHNRSKNDDSSNSIDDCAFEMGKPKYRNVENYALNGYHI